MTVVWMAAVPENHSKADRSCLASYTHLIVTLPELIYVGAPSGSVTSDVSQWLINLYKGVKTTVE